MEFDRKGNIYKIVMTIFITALITFCVTAVGVNNYLTNKKINAFDKKLIESIDVIKDRIDNVYLGEMEDEDTLIEWAVKGYVAGLGDEYTEYLTKEEYEDLMIDVNGNYVGIGIYMSQDKSGNIVILMPIEGSPAEEAGLKSGDIIKKVNGEECLSADLTVIANKVKGEEGTKVELEIERDSETLTKTVERRTVQINHVKTEILEGNIGYIQILAFDEGSSIEFEEKLDELLSKKIKSLIIDVRDNGGGIVSEATNIADMFVEKNDKIMVELDKNENSNVTEAKKSAKVKDINVILLINENSASASEILVGALTDNGIAKTVGTTTFGKGVMQEILPLTSGGALKVTIKEFRTPNGNIINKKGIEPETKIEDDTKTEEDEQLQKAIELCK